MFYVSVVKVFTAWGSEDDWRDCNSSPDASRGE